ncbi:MAG: bifunctional hydroxymethylpyrimidine kinase/phosphomethylpyrimidine kinase [Rhodospirillales bacterium]
MPGRVLIVAGSDSGGGAGIQADIKTVTALGGYAATAITALTAQNTRGVFAIHDVPAEFVALQMRLVLDDIGADCVKIGMLHRPDVIAVVCDVLRTNARGVPVVVDPVMIAKGGDALLTADGAAVIKTELIPLAQVLTPNLPEAVALCGEAGDATELARRLLALGPEAVLIKGGHGEGPRIVDLLACRDGTLKRFECDRIDTPHTHGTGCTLASAIATGLAQGRDVTAAVERARAYVLEAIRTAPGLGSGHGPLNHGHTVRSFPGAA